MLTAGERTSHFHNRIGGEYKIYICVGASLCGRDDGNATAARELRYLNWEALF